MSTPRELLAVRERFIQLLRTDLKTANHIADVLALRYANRTREADPDLLMYAAVWAARRYEDVPPKILPTLDTREILDIVKRSDCPLCEGEADDSEGSGAAHTPASPVGMTA